MTELSLPHKVAKTVGVGLSFLLGRTLSVRILVGLHNPGCKHLTLGFKPGCLGQIREPAPDTWREGKPARLAAALGCGHLALGLPCPGR
jgi:hypothetical protein